MARMVVSLEEKAAHVGSDSLHDKMRRRWPRSQPPSARTLQRWLTAAGMTRPRRHRAQPGPVRLRPAHILGDRPNDVWTVDFKGPMTPSGSPKLEPLTVFDLASRFGLMARQLAAKDCRCTRSAFQELFHRYGLPRAIQVDNGPPFGSEGPLGLTRLTVEWMLLGIHVQFGRPSCPQDNPEHERWHRTMQRDVVLTPTSGKETWQARLNRFLQIYNTDRAHHALGLKLPCDLYRPSRRRLLRPKPRRKYPANWTTIRLNAKGCLWWQKKVRHIGIAFGTQLLGLRPTEPGQCEVYLNHLLLGVLVATDQAGMRPIQLRRIQL